MTERNVATAARVTRSMHVAEDMLAYLDDPDHWVQGKYEMGEQRCLLGAHGAVVYGDADHWAGSRRRPGSSRLLRQLADIIREQYPERMVRPWSTGDVIAGFNDHPGTRHAEVVAVLEKLVVREQEDA
jgi:hypothetical protein